MGDNESTMNDLLRAVKERERKSLIRAAIFTLVPFLFAVMLIFFTTYQVTTANAELEEITYQRNEAQDKLTKINARVGEAIERFDEVQGEKRILEVEVGRIQGELTEARSELERVQKLNTRLREEVDMLRGFHENFVNLRPDLLKSLSTVPDVSREVLERVIIIRMELNPRWELGGTSPEEGFDSPNFALYIIRQITDRYNNLPRNVNASMLMRVLEATNNPKPGDLVFYDEGYTMFYFDEPRTGPFVVGMTPIGIQALRLEFGPRLLRYGRVEY